MGGGVSEPASLAKGSRQLATDGAVLPLRFPQTFTATSLLAFGAFLLLAGWLLSEPTRGWSTIPLGLLAIPLHLLAWVQLAREIQWDRGEKWAYAASVLGPIPGVALLAYLAGWDGLLTPYAGLLPYLPPVFAPVVAAHGILFLGRSLVLRRPRARFAMRGGAIVLLGLAGLALGIAGFRIPPLIYPLGLAWSLAGLTVVGYLTVSMSLASERA